MLGRNRREALRKKACCLKPEPLEHRYMLTTAAAADPYPDVAYYGTSRDWAVNAINAPEVWAQGYTGEDVVVAVLDTGIDLDHRDLDENIWNNADEIAGNGIDDDSNGYVDDVYGWDFVSNDAVPSDTNGHGTHVAGIVAAEANGTGATGVAYSASIMPVQVLGASGEGDVFDIASGIYYAVDNGADIINLSLGSEGSVRRVRNAISYAEANDVLIVAAAGNESENTPGYPAAYSSTFDNVISVGAFDSNYNLASFSNAVGVSRAVQVDAPGVAIYSTIENGRYATFSGTSMSAPVVSGLAALALSAEPTLAVGALRTIIVDTATLQIDSSDSAGGVNAAFAMATIAPLVAPDITDSGNANEDEPTMSVAVFADLDGDGVVAFSDFIVLSQNFGQEGDVTDGDLDGDGYISFGDFLLLSGSLGSQSTDPQTLIASSVDNVFASAGLRSLV